MAELHHAECRGGDSHHERGRDGAGDPVISIAEDVCSYEAWLRKQCDVVEPDLRAKHRSMQQSEFTFLRATYFRWARTPSVGRQ